MTREEAISIMKVIVHMLEEKYDTDRVEEAVDMAIEALQQKPICPSAGIDCEDCPAYEKKSEWEHDHEILKAYSDGANEMLDKIRAEIVELWKNEPCPIEYGCLDEILQIIDKYKSEGSDKE